MEYHICLDPGHSVDIPGKWAPDKSLYEHAFALDIAKRMRSLLEELGVTVTMTRETEYNISLQDRVKKANLIRDLDLFVSLHSASAGREGWYDTKGFAVYTASADRTAKRNIAAGALIKRAREAGIPLYNQGLGHNLFYVLRYTSAPAVLIEHGFHTNREEAALMGQDAYREKLALVNVGGICDFLRLPVTNLEDLSAALARDKALPSLKSAAHALARQGIIHSPDYWTAGAYSPSNVQTLIRRCAAALAP